MTADRSDLAPAPRPLPGACVLVLGLGASGLAMAAWCARQGAEVRAWDTRLGSAAGEALARTLAERAPAANLLPSGLSDAAAALDGIDRVFKSPGLAPGDPAVAPLLAATAARGIAVGGELDLFGEALAGLKADRDYAPRLLAVTGTNGKTTTTALTALLVERAGRRVAVAGNIGPTLLGTLSAALDGDAPLPEVWVLELSSFQLHDAHGFEPDAAALLNLSQDHLDWHGTMDAYGADKARIFGHRTVRIVNRDDALVERIATEAAAPAAGGRRRTGGRSSSADRKAAAPRRPSSASASTRRASRATSDSSSTRAWPGWCAGRRPRRRRDATARPCRSRCSGSCRPTRCAFAAATTPPTRWPRWRSPRRSAARSRRCCTACANTAASRTASPSSPASTASTISTTARAPTSARPSPRSTASAPTARREAGCWSSSAATARARTSRRSPRRWPGRPARWR